MPSEIENPEPICGKPWGLSPARGSHYRSYPACRRQPKPKPPFMSYIRSSRDREGARRSTVAPIAPESQPSAFDQLFRVSGYDGSGSLGMMAPGLWVYALWVSGSLNQPSAFDQLSRIGAGESIRARVNRFSASGVRHLSYSTTQLFS
jgi:hypothetical protein